MPDTFVVVAEFAGAVGSGLAGGVFFAFSTFVMQGLARLPAADGARAMNAINVTAVTPAFMCLLFGTAVLCAMLLVLSTFRWDDPGMRFSALAAVIYLAGAIGVTMLRNVPLNNALAADGNAEMWARYLRDWVMWNHLRTIACTVTCALFIAALWQQARAG